MESVWSTDKLPHVLHIIYYSNSRELITMTTMTIEFTSLNGCNAITSAWVICASHVSSVVIRSRIFKGPVSLDIVRDREKVK